MSARRSRRARPRASSTRVSAEGRENSAPCRAACRRRGHGVADLLEQSAGGSTVGSMIRFNPSVGHAVAGRVDLVAAGVDHAHDVGAACRTAWASKSRLDTPIIGSSSACAKPFAVAMPTRRPVNSPGRCRRRLRRPGRARYPPARTRTGSRHENLGMTRAAGYLPTRRRRLSVPSATPARAVADSMPRMITSATLRLDRASALRPAVELERVSRRCR